MSWRRDEVWLDTDLPWFGEQPRRPFGALALAVPAGAGAALELPRFPPAETGLEASRRRRQAKQAARRRRFVTRTAPAFALVVGSATMLPIAALRQDGAARATGPLWEDPPSLTFRFDYSRLEASPASPASAAQKGAGSRARAAEPAVATIEWGRATSYGLPYSGRLVDGTQLPVEGPNWTTWNPVTDSAPNLAQRLYGHERTIRTILSVTAAYRKAHPQAPQVVIGDISLEDGGAMNEHASHQSGLDVDVYYPRLDRHLSAPIAPGQIDRRLSQDLLDRFVAAGAQVVFVGYSTGLRGPSGLVVPYPSHENHMHVRFPPPAG